MDKKIVQRNKMTSRSALVAKLLELHGDKCPHCDRVLDNTTCVIDHIIPMAMGGTHEIDNMQLLCQECNEVKGMIPYSLKWDTIQKLKYRANAGIPSAQAELKYRMEDRAEIPLPGLHGEKLYLTGYTALHKKAEELNIMYEKVPVHRGMKEIILLDAWSSATIEGARTTVEKVKQSFNNPRTKDDRMVINAITGSNYAYGRPITSKNIRKLWDKVVDGVCENENLKGTKYRNGMVYIGSNNEIIHIPAEHEQLPELMEKWFAYCEADTPDLLIRSFVAHFYFVYVHPFCDGNGRTARILNASLLYHNGYKKMKSLPLANSINNQLRGYYNSLSDSETVQNGSVLGDMILGTTTLGEAEKGWLDLSPFVFYMLDVFEHCLTDAALSKNMLTEAEKKILSRMNKIGMNAEITTRKAAGILQLSESATRAVLKGLVDKGYLSVDTSKSTFIYRLQQHFVE